MSKVQKISFEDISFTNMLQVEALILIKKGIITKDEYQREVERVHRDYMERTKLRDAKDHPEQ